MQDSVATNRAWASARSFAGVDYFRKVLAVSPGNLIGYWPMDDDPGSSVAIDYSGRDNDGAYTSVPLGQAGIGDRRTSALFDGSVSFNNIYSAALNVDFDGAEGAMMAWGRVSGAGVWADNTTRRIAELRVNAENRIFNYKGADNRLWWAYEAGNVLKAVSLVVTPTEFFHMIITWSASAGADGEMIAHYNGGQTGSMQTSLGTWAGNLSSVTTVIGAGSTIPTILWSGTLAHVALWAGAGSPAAVQAAAADLAVV